MPTSTFLKPQDMNNTPDHLDLAYRFLATERSQAPPLRPLRADTTTHHLRLSTPADWRDGPVLDLAVHQRGQGPATLLVHGWRGQAGDFDSLADRLVEGGRTVWMPDLPGHGRSGGEHLSAPLAAAALLAVQSLAGRFDFAAAHSFGGACLVHAMTLGLQVNRVALLAPPTHYGEFARRAAVQAGLPPDQLSAWIELLGRTIGTNPDTLVMREQVQHLNLPALLVHSRDDRIAPFAAVEAVAQAWQGARWWPRDGLGHFKLLNDAATLQALCAFAAGD